MDCQARQGRAADAIRRWGRLMTLLTRMAFWRSATQTRRPGRGNGSPPSQSRHGPPSALTRSATRSPIISTGSGRPAKNPSRRLRRASGPSSYPNSADVEVGSLTAPRLRKWHMDIAAASPRLRTRPGERQKVRDASDDPEAPRRRHATANRILTVLKAALNHAWREGKVASDDAWRRVTPFREADAARVHYLNREECRRLVNASPLALRMIVRGALLSGARYSELARMHVADFHRDSGTLLVRTSKAGKSAISS